MVVCDDCADSKYQALFSSVAALVRLVDDLNESKEEWHTGVDEKQKIRPNIPGKELSVAK